MDFFWENDKQTINRPLFDPTKVIEFPSVDLNIEEFLSNNSSFLQIPPLIALERIEKGNSNLNDLIKLFQVLFSFSLFPLSFFSFFLFLVLTILLISYSLLLFFSNHFYFLLYCY